MLPVLNEQETTGKDSRTLQKAWFQETQSPLKIESIHWLCEKKTISLTSTERISGQGGI